MKVLVSVISQSLGSIGNLTLILVIVMYIFAVVGMQVCAPPPISLPLLFHFFCAISLCTSRSSGEH